MHISLHKNATTTLAVRAAIQQSSGSNADLAREFHVTPRTIARWKARDSVHDASHTPRTGCNHLECCPGGIGHLFIKKPVNHPGPDR